MTYKTVLILTVSLLLFLRLSAQDSLSTFSIQNTPNPLLQGKWVSDPSSILSAVDRDRIQAAISEIHERTTVEIAVVLLPDIKYKNPKAFATNLFNYWGIGKSETDNGLLILTVLNQRRTEFETGYGLESILPDILCYRIGMQQLVPRFQEGDYASGILNTLSEFRKLLEDPNAREVLSAPQTSQNRRPFPWMILFVYLAILSLFHLILLVSVRHTLKQPSSFYDKFLNLRKWRLLIWIFLFPLPYIAVYWWLSKKLQHLRNAPRFGPNTGLPMRKLTETDEDQHLNIGQITEEKIGSVDYDVWVTPGGEEVQILRYARIFTNYEPCPECGYLTYSLSSHQIIEAATHSKQDESEIVYTCKNCHFVKKERTTMPRILSSGGGSSGRSSSGGSGSFGGGRSGGGGGGVSW